MQLSHTFSLPYVCLNPRQVIYLDTQISNFREGCKSIISPPVLSWYFSTKCFTQCANSSASSPPNPLPILNRGLLELQLKRKTINLSISEKSFSNYRYGHSTIYTNEQIFTKIRLIKTVFPTHHIPRKNYYIARNNGSSLAYKLHS